MEIETNSRSCELYLLGVLENCPQVIYNNYNRNNKLPCIKNVQFAVVGFIQEQELIMQVG